MLRFLGSLGELRSAGRFPSLLERWVGTNPAILAGKRIPEILLPLGQDHRLTIAGRFDGAGIVIYSVGSCSRGAKCALASALRRDTEFAMNAASSPNRIGNS